MIKALMAFNSSDAPPNWNDRFRDILKPGIYYGGDVTAHNTLVNGKPAIVVAPFVAVTAEGMVVRDDTDSQIIPLAFNANQVIGLRVKYQTTQPPIIEWLAVLSSSRGLIPDPESILWFAQVVTDGAGVVTTSTTTLTVLAGSSGGSLTANDSNVSSFFNNGILKFTSGPNTGASRLVTAHNNSNGVSTFTFDSPFDTGILTGNTFEVSRASGIQKYAPHRLDAIGRNQIRPAVPTVDYLPGNALNPNDTNVMDGDVAYVLEESALGAGDGNSFYRFRTGRGWNVIGASSIAADLGVDHYHFDGDPQPTSGHHKTIHTSLADGLQLIQEVALTGNSSKRRVYVSTDGDLANYVVAINCYFVAGSPNIIFIDSKAVSATAFFFSPAGYAIRTKKSSIAAQAPSSWNDTYAADDTSGWDTEVFVNTNTGVADLSTIDAIVNSLQVVGGLITNPNTSGDDKGGLTITSSATDSATVDFKFTSTPRPNAKTIEILGGASGGAVSIATLTSSGDWELRGHLKCADVYAGASPAGGGTVYASALTSLGTGSLTLTGTSSILNTPDFIFYTARSGVSRKDELGFAVVYGSAQPLDYLLKIYNNGTMQIKGPGTLDVLPTSLGVAQTFDIGTKTTTGNLTLGHNDTVSNTTTTVLGNNIFITSGNGEIKALAGSTLTLQASTAVTVDATAGGVLVRGKASGGAPDVTVRPGIARINSDAILAVANSTLSPSTYYLQVAPDGLHALRLNANLNSTKTLGIGDDANMTTSVSIGTSGVTAVSIGSTGSSASTKLYGSSIDIRGAASSTVPDISLRTVASRVGMLQPVFGIFGNSSTVVPMIQVTNLGSSAAPQGRLHASYITGGGLDGSTQLPLNLGTDAYTNQVVIGAAARLTNNLGYLTITGQNGSNVGLSVDAKSVFSGDVTIGSVGAAALNLTHYGTVTISKAVSGTGGNLSVAGVATCSTPTTSASLATTLTTKDYVDTLTVHVLVSVSAAGTPSIVRTNAPVSISVRNTGNTFFIDYAPITTNSIIVPTLRVAIGDGRNVTSSTIQNIAAGTVGFIFSLRADDFMHGSQYTSSFMFSVLIIP